MDEPVVTEKKICSIKTSEADGRMLSRRVFLLLHVRTSLLPLHMTGTSSPEAERRSLLFLRHSTQQQNNRKDCYLPQHALVLYPRTLASQQLDHLYRMHFGADVAGSRSISDLSCLFIRLGEQS